MVYVAYPVVRFEKVSDSCIGRRQKYSTASVNSGEYCSNAIMCRLIDHAWPSKKFKIWTKWKGYCHKSTFYSLLAPVKTLDFRRDSASYNEASWKLAGGIGILNWLRLYETMSAVYDSASLRIRGHWPVQVDIQGEKSPVKEVRFPISIKHLSNKKEGIFSLWSLDR